MREKLLQACWSGPCRESGEEIETIIGWEKPLGRKGF